MSNTRRASLFALPTLLGLVVAACGGGGGNTGGTSSGTGGKGGNGGNGGGTGGHGGEIIIIDDAGCSSTTTCAAAGANCGDISDGCGATLHCGDCTLPETCGGTGTANVCGQYVCQPRTCADLGSDCGANGDGCGNALDCGSCSLPKTCSGTPSKCSIPANCTGLCMQQVSCPGGGTTTVSGIVRAPGKGATPGDPLLGALVYIPNAAVQPFGANVACETCTSAVSGSPLVSATSGVDGTFTLSNVPVGTSIPLVIQLGRWRRQITISTVTACQDNPLTVDQTRLPRNKGEGDIPKMAISTGAVDSLECVLRKIGIDDAEFTKPTGNGRIHIFTGAGASGSSAGTGTPSEATLMADAAVMKQYDMLLFPCQGNEYYSNRGAAAAWTDFYSRLLDYTASGGRVFATHYSYVWLHGKPSGTAWSYGPGAWESVATWHADQSAPADQNGAINTTFPKGQAFAQWLINVGASTVLGQMPVKVVRHDADAVGADGQLWMSATNPAGVPLHFTFNTPTTAAADAQCGRVVFSDFHVSNASTGGTTFPGECNNNAMTPQEKLVEFMLFDLASCVTPDVPVCTPKSCADQQIGCGPAGDGCGNLIQCGDCVAPETCGGGGPGKCGTNTCHPKTCVDLNAQCGPVSDGCGAVLQCGTCVAPQTCGGGGVASKCGGGGPA